MTNLDEKGLEAAFFAWIENPVGNASVKELIASAIAAYLAHGGNEPVAVKRLDWRFFDMKHEYGRGVWEANAFFSSSYEIVDCSESGYLPPYVYYCRKLSLSFAAVDDAKAAAQADYETHIRSALVPSLAHPSGEAKGEPVAWRWRFQTDYDNSLTDWCVSGERLSSDAECWQYRGLEVQPLYAHPSEDYRRGIEDAAKVAMAQEWRDFSKEHGMMVRIAAAILSLVKKPV